ncbi:MULTISPECIES: dicarboxylate/amino acid:cation symporter [Nostoc]|uniref:Dicarboxylate/amino acid:cation symporter n=1 Tax=Nostoc paludosum FACHB-159 TaxID=2692908 RepID=A0ABR8K2E7_9NOSO|nr:MULTISPECIES: dicarboxylate/amino acid:cation symporter [Nostoc]MBD2676544.1 dicarboxylate/amino acid:cation symporter [Nostoc sp. FACHB-857]MBD2732322.1 dicarboxylate/amino acid:cation symporter [Nostoc paludosum FACHB-159]
MSHPDTTTSPETKARPWWQRIPLTLQIVIALVAAVSVGIALGAGNPSPSNATLINNLAIPAELVLKALRALATPLILVAVLHTLMTTNIPGTTGRRLFVLLLTNTSVAILVGLFVANVLRPGTWGNVVTSTNTQITAQNLDPWGLVKDAVPEAVLKPLVDNNVIQLIVIALSFGIVLRGLKSEQIAQGKNGYQPIEDVIGILFEAVVRILNWVIALVPLAVFGIVAKTVAKEGFAPFQSLGAFIIAVLVALLLQAFYYLTRVKFGSWVDPLKFLAGGSDAFLTAFSTSSSAAAMPITFEVLQTKVGLRESSAALGALVGANFNNDGTALYEAMSALYISQLIGQHLSLGQQVIVILTSIFASVGAANIPNAGLVTMTLVFTSVGLPTQYIALLVTVDWFLDRCRTAINVMGDMTVSTLLDGKKPRTLDEA